MIPLWLRRRVPRRLVRFVNLFRPAHGRLAEIRYRENEAREQLRLEHEARNRATGPGVVVLRDNLPLRVHPDSVEPFEHFCFRSPAMVQELDVFIAIVAGRRRLLDIGALHGIFSLVFAARPGTEAVAVDASPLAFARLLYNIRRNQRDTVIRAFEHALSDAEGNLRMHYHWEHAVAGPTAARDARFVEVTKITGDALCARLNFNPDTIKIDVEGHEVKVLRGLERVLTEHRPLIFLEVHPGLIAAEGETGADLLPMFRALGYRACTLAGDPVSFDQLFATDDRFVLSAGGSHGPSAERAT